ncbi:MAG TPA: cell division protein FtsZ [Solirubrobacteraceae bacterium]|nr:cell division protein FtsZ [Solirubrobacteraceae bacterium]
MATGKRASMREGPLADLFRKTAEDDSTQKQAPAPKRSAEERSAEQRSAEQRSAPPRSAPPRPVPHPSLDAELDSPVDLSRPPAPSAQERLRAAFSADIPEDILAPPAAAPADDVYAVADRDLTPPEPIETGQPVLRVVGVGGAGVNAVNRMVEADIRGVEFLAINTDLQSLQLSAADETLHIGDGVTRGLGSGADPELGRRAAREEYDRIKAMLRGSDMVFIAAGAGGGTGTGAAPVVAQIARELGALTVGIITRPFGFEGSRRRDQAEAGVVALGEEVDTLIVVPNNRLLSVLDRNVSMVEAFRVADDVLRQGVQGVSDLVTLPGLINLDFADVRTIMADAGSALLGIGMGTGERRAIDAAEQAVASPLLETSMDGARSILLSITGGPDTSLWEVNEAAKTISEAAHPDANIIFGAMVDDKLEDQVWITVVATGFGEQPRRRNRDDPFAAAPRVEDPLQDRSRRWREPREPRVTRNRPSRRAELDVPEFIPRR